MNQNNNIKSYVVFKNLVYVLAGLLVICFFLPLAKISVGGEDLMGMDVKVELSTFKLATGVDIDGAKVPNSAPIFLILIPSILILVMWILKDLHKIQDNLATLICLVAASIQFSFAMIGTIFVSSITRLGAAGGSYLGSSFKVHSGAGVILSWICSLILIVLFIMFSIQKINPADNIMHSNASANGNATDTAAANAQPVQTAQPVQPVQTAQTAQPTQPVEEKNDSITCPNCGTKLAAGTKFCISCGTKIDNN